MKSIRVGSMALATSALLIGSTGCLGHQTATSARTLDAGRTEVTASAAVDWIVFPQGRLQVRHGLSDRVELGAGLGANGLSVHSKFGLVRSGAQDGANVAIGPTVHGFTGNLGGHPRTEMGAFLPLLLGVRIQGNEVTLAPYVGWQRVIGVPDSTTTNDHQTFYGGATLGVAMRVGGSFLLTPELGLKVLTDASQEYFSAIPTLGLSFTWGR